MKKPQYKKGGDKKYTQEDLDMYLAMYMNGGGMNKYQNGGNFKSPFAPPLEASLPGFDYSYQTDESGDLSSYMVNGSGDSLPQKSIPYQEQQREVQQPIGNTISPVNIAEPDYSIKPDEIQQSIANKQAELNPEQRRGVELTDNPNIQFFNQYQGVDIPTAATTLGSSIQQGDTLGTIASSLKLATGLGRNIVGGMGLQNQYQRQQKDYYEKVGDLGAAKSLQDGGSYSNDDLSNYMMDTDPVKNTIKSNMEKQGRGFNTQEVAELEKLGFIVDEGGDSNLFDISQGPIPRGNTPELDFGRYKDLNYFNTAISGDEYRITPTKKNPANAEVYRENLEYLQKLNPNVKINRRGHTSGYLPYEQRQEFQAGGQYQGDEYRTGLDEEMLSDNEKQLLNAETEAGEYIKDPNTGEVSEIIGKKHSQGGEKMIMEEGEKVLTDHTKLGAADAKYIRDTYDIDVKAKNTYADTLDKLRSKSGLKKLIKEEEDYIKQLEEQEKAQKGTTQGINSKFLKDKLEEVKSKKAPLETVRQAMFDDLYRIQESKKSQEPTNEFQDGGRYTGEGSALDKVPGGQSKNEDFYGRVDDTQFAQTVANNPWFDFTNFDPNNPQDVARFQSEYNRLSTKGTKVRVDGKFGEQTQTIKLPQETLKALDLKPVGLQNQSPTVPDLPPLKRQEIQQLIDSGASEEEVRKAMNVALLPNQYPMLPNSLEAVSKNTRSYERFDPALIDPTIYLENLRRQQLQAEMQTEGLPPQARAAALANIQANTNKAAADAMLRIDTQNIGSKNRAEEMNVRVGQRQEDARVQDDLNYEGRILQAKALTDNDLSNYFNAGVDANVQGYKDINALNRANIVSNHQFTGSGYVSPSTPDFSKYYQMTQDLTKYQKEQEEAKKKKTKK